MRVPYEDSEDMQSIFAKGHMKSSLDGRPSTFSYSSLELSNCLLVFFANDSKERKKKGEWIALSMICLCFSRCIGSLRVFGYFESLGLGSKIGFEMDSYECNTLALVFT